MSSEHISVTFGIMLWLVIAYPLWSPRCRRIRRIQRTRRVSGNEARPRVSNPTGLAWEQDAPYPEVFEEEEMDTDISTECRHESMVEVEDHGLLHVSCEDCPYHYTIDLMEVP